MVRIFCNKVNEYRDDHAFGSQFATSFTWALGLHVNKVFKGFLPRKKIERFTFLSGNTKYMPAMLAS